MRQQTLAKPYEGESSCKCPHALLITELLAIDFIMNLSSQPFGQIIGWGLVLVSVLKIT